MSEFPTDTPKASDVAKTVTIRDVKFPISEMPMLTASKGKDNNDVIFEHTFPKEKYNDVFQKDMQTVWELKFPYKLEDLEASKRAIEKDDEGTNEVMNEVIRLRGEAELVIQEKFNVVTTLQHRDMDKWTNLYSQDQGELEEWILMRDHPDLKVMFSTAVKCTKKDVLDKPLYKQLKKAQAAIRKVRNDAIKKTDEGNKRLKE